MTVGPVDPYPTQRSNIVSAINDALKPDLDPDHLRRVICKLLNLCYYFDSKLRKSFEKLLQITATGQPQVVLHSVVYSVKNSSLDQILGFKVLKCFLIALEQILSLESELKDKQKVAICDTLSHLAYHIFNGSKQYFKEKTHVIFQKYFQLMHFQSFLIFIELQCINCNSLEYISLLSLLPKKSYDLSNSASKLLVNCLNVRYINNFSFCLTLLLQKISKLFIGERILSDINLTLRRHGKISFENMSVVYLALPSSSISFLPDILDHILEFILCDDNKINFTAQCIIKELSNQCSDYDILLEAYKKLANLIKNKDSRLVSNAAKISVVNAIGSFSFNKLSIQQSERFGDNVIRDLIAFFKSYAFDQFQISTLGVCLLYCRKYYSAVPEDMFDWIKKSNFQNFSPALKCETFNILLEVFSKSKLMPKSIDFFDLCEKSVKKASKTAIALVPIHREGISASYLVLQMYTQGVIKVNDIDCVLDYFQQSKKLLSLRFILEGDERALEQLSAALNLICMECYCRLSKEAITEIVVYLSLAILLSDYKVRKQSQTSLNSILTNCSDVFSVLIASINEIYEQWCNQCDTISNNCELSPSEVNEQLRHRGKLMINFCIFIGMKSRNLFTIEELCPFMLRVLNTKAVLFSKLSALSYITKLLQMPPDDITISFLLELEKVDTLSELHKRILITTTNICNEAYFEKVVDIAINILSDEQIFSITDKDVGIRFTKEGELFDKNVMVQVKRIDQSSKNMKREDKNMKWKDEKSFREMNKTEDKLTKKQQDMLDKHLQHESEIRSKVISIERRVSFACKLLNGCLQGNSKFFLEKLWSSFPTLVKLLKSAVSAKIVLPIFDDIAFHLFSHTGKSFFYSRIVVCLLQPHECLGISRANIYTSSKTLIDSILLSIFPVGRFGESTHLFPPMFTFVFPSFRCLIREISNNSLTSECDKLDMVSNIINIFKVQTQISDSEELQQMPLLHILSTLFLILENYPPTLQNITHQVTLQVCRRLILVQKTFSHELLDDVLQFLQSGLEIIRKIALDCVEYLFALFPFNEGEVISLTALLYMLQYDEDDEVSDNASKLWHQTGFSLHDKRLELCDELLKSITSNKDFICNMAAIALQTLVRGDQVLTENICCKLMSLYSTFYTYVPAEFDSVGRIIVEEVRDVSQPRIGIALAFKYINADLSDKNVIELLQFLINKPLCDHSEDVRKCMLDAGLTLIDNHGEKVPDSMLNIFESVLSNSNDKDKNQSLNSCSVVVLMGSLAKHLDPQDPKVKPIIGKLIQALSTPSKTVQEAVANCLPSLVSSLREDAEDLIKKLLGLLLSSEDITQRRGAAYGLAGLVKGLGVTSLNKLNIMPTLQEAIDDKKVTLKREGALLGFQMLCLLLGRLFEPYLVQILPHLLLSFGDNQKSVRTIAEETAKIVMQKLTVFGVKIVLPSLVKALEEDSWRTKVGSTELLGAMSHCAPKQLSSCLPSIVPQLLFVLNDSHHKVAAAALQALKQVGSVIKNPEIQSITPVILDALSDPPTNTANCLKKLLETRFVHLVDAPSLSLIMPIVENAFKDRSSDVRKMSCQILANMYSLTDEKDLAPYLPKIIPGLKIVLVDPVPDIRTYASKALGAMVRGIGERGFSDLLPWLISTMTSESSNIDRAGAAQGLSEVLASLGPRKLSQHLPDYIARSMDANNSPYVRDGYILLFAFLPGAFGNDFTPHIPEILPSVIQTLASEVEFLRESAFKVSQQIINLFSTTSVNIFLPVLEQGLFDDNWRIRLSSVQLLGDLLFRLLGVTGKMSTETNTEDETFATEKLNRQFANVLGYERRNRVLAGLYLGRNDVTLSVRQASLHVWKIVVSNTPKTLREILPILFTLILKNLTCNSDEKRQISARTLGDLTKKLGDRVLPEIVPILDAGMNETDESQRQGVCIGISEVMMASSSEQVEEYLNVLQPTISRGLCDSDSGVREAAAGAFERLYNIIQNRALEKVIKPLLVKVDDPKIGEFALDGLRQVMSLKSRIILPYLVPLLLKPPVNVIAITSIASVAGSSLNHHIDKILPVLLSSLANSFETEMYEHDYENISNMLISSSGNVDVLTILNYVIEGIKNNNVYSPSAAQILAKFIENTPIEDLADHVNHLFKELILVLTYPDDRLYSYILSSLHSIVSRLDSAEKLNYIFSLRQALRSGSAEMKGKFIPGLCVESKGVVQILPIFREGILNGSPDFKEQAAYGISEAIMLTSSAALKPSVINITGPLIRILGDRYSHTVRSAILDALGLLLDRVGLMLKAFVPQLQNTFLKALGDMNDKVKLKAALALGNMMKIHSRPDPVFNDLASNIKKSEDGSYSRDVYLYAMKLSIVAIGNKLSEATQNLIVSCLEPLISVEDEQTRRLVGGCFGALVASIETNFSESVVEKYFKALQLSPSIEVEHCFLTGLSTIALLNSKLFLEAPYLTHYVILCKNICQGQRVISSQTSLVAIANLILYQECTFQQPDGSLLESLRFGLLSSNFDIRQQAARAVDYICEQVIKKNSDASKCLKVFIANELLRLLEDSSLVVKKCVEQALCRIYLLHLPTFDSSSLNDVLEDRQCFSLQELSRKMSAKYRSKSLDLAEDIDMTRIT